MVYGSFNEAMKERGMESFILSSGLVKRMPLNTQKLVSKLEEAIKSNKKIFCDPDCDPDGYFSGLCMKTMFDKIGFSNYTIPLHTNKRHSLSQTFMTSIIEGGYDVVVILDSSSNDMDGIHFLCEHGITVLVIDHHDTNYVFKDYPENCVIVNPRIDRRFKQADYAEMSAGALTALICDMTLETVFHISNNKELYVYGYITLYSDSCDLNNKTNREFIMEFKDFGVLPEIVNLFMTRYDSFNRNFVSWRMIPRINSLIRAEEFEFIYKLFYDRRELMMSKESTMSFIEQIYSQSKRRARDFEGIGKIHNYENIVCLELPHSLYQSYRNYTGLIAAQLSTEYSKAAMCVVGASYESLEGSVRDTLNRDLKSIFQTLCYAEGHPAAFGVEVKADQLENVLSIADSMKEAFAWSEDAIVVDWDIEDPTVEAAESEIYRMATYNEFSGGSVPVAYATVTLHEKFKFRPMGKCSRAVYNGFKFVSFKNTLVPGCRVMCKPIFSGVEPEMVVEAIIS